MIIEDKNVKFHSSFSNDILSLVKKDGYTFVKRDNGKEEIVEPFDNSNLMHKKLQIAMGLTKKPFISETKVELVIRSKFPEQSRLLEDLYSTIGLTSAVYVNMGENKKAFVSFLDIICENLMGVYSEIGKKTKMDFCSKELTLLCKEMDTQLKQFDERGFDVNQKNKQYDFLLGVMFLQTALDFLMKNRKLIVNAQEVYDSVREDERSLNELRKNNENQNQ